MNQEIKIPTKDELIVRQSQLQRSIEIFQLTGRKPSIQEICRLSQVLTEFIFTWDHKSEALKNFDKLILKEKIVKSLTPENK